MLYSCQEILRDLNTIICSLKPILDYLLEEPTCSALESHDGLTSVNATVPNIE